MTRKIALGELSKIAMTSPGPNSPLVLKPVSVNTESLKAFEEWMKIAADNVTLKSLMIENYIQKYLVSLSYRLFH